MRLTRGLGIALGVTVGLAGVRLLTAMGSPSGMVAVAAGEVPSDKIAALVLVVGLLLLLLIVVVGIGIKVFDLGGRREEEAEWLQMMIAEALRREVGYLPVVPVVRVPSSQRFPVIVELAGRVPTPELRDLVRQIVEEEVSRRRPHHQIDDRLEVVDGIAAA